MKMDLGKPRAEHYWPRPLLFPFYFLPAHPDTFLGTEHVIEEKKSM